MHWLWLLLCYKDGVGELKWNPHGPQNPLALYRQSFQTPTVKYYSLEVLPDKFMCWERVNAPQLFSALLSHNLKNTENLNLDDSLFSHAEKLKQEIVLKSKIRISSSSNMVIKSLLLNDSEKLFFSSHGS